MYDRIIFVCEGNHSKGPMAETIYKSLTENESIPAISRGLVVLFSEPVNEKAVSVLENLTMTDKQKKQAIDKYEIENDIFSIKEFNGEEGEVKDPYGGTLVDYEECYNELLRLIKKTIYKLDEMGK